MKIFFLLLYIFLPAISFAQIWQETFDGLADGSTSDNGTTAWTIDYSGPGYFEKRTFPGYQVIAINDTDNEGSWLSEEIDISPYSEVEIKLTLGGYWANNSDYIRCYYKIDGGEEVFFGEQFGSPGLIVTSLASAIVSGSTLQIIIKGNENTDEYYGPYERVMGFDDITVSEITYLYSRSSGNWTNNSATSGTWSRAGYGGASCSCTPNQDTHVFIGDGNIVNLNGNATTAGLTIENTGKLNYTANAALNIVRGGVLEIAQEGILDRNGQTGSLNFSTYTYTVAVDGDLSVNQINLDKANVSFTGSGNIQVANNFVVNNAIGKTITNNLSGDFSVGGQLSFESNSSNVQFKNTGNFNIANRILFNNKTVTLINEGTLSTGTNGLVINENSDDGNVLTNSGTLEVGAINLGSADFTLNNTGTINQTGDFSDIASGSEFHNLEGSTWNFSGGGANARLFASAANNTFNYSGSSTQNIFVPADGAYHHLTASGSGPKTLTGNLDITGDLTIAGAAQMDVSANNYAVVLAGDWQVNSSHPDPFVEQNGSVSFSGSTTQTIATVSEEATFSNLNIAKPSGNLVLSSTNLTVSDALTLAQGGLELNGNHLYISNSSQSAIFRTNGFIKSEKSTFPYSTVRWAVGPNTGAYIFPFGKSAAPEDYVPFIFDITDAGTGAGTVALATYATREDNAPFPSGVTDLNTTDGSDNSSNVVDRFWQIDLEDYTVNPTVSVTFTATPEEMNGISSLVAQRWNSITGSWDAPLEGQTHPHANAVTVPGVSSFSPWGLSGNNSLLPIELLYFKASWQDGKAILQWATTQEKNNDYFTVERSKDLRTFSEVLQIPGQGTSQVENIYQATDPHPLGGNSYYRLKQTDFDGTSTYSKIVAFQNAGVVPGQIKLFPNPLHGQELNITFPIVYDSESLPITIFNASGQRVHSTAIIPAAVSTIVLPHRLTQGIYMVRIGNSHHTKLIVE